MLEETQQCIKTFAILDVEVNDYSKYQYNQCSLTELCFYAISSNYLQNDIINNGSIGTVPELPRALDKISLMINPQRRIHDYTRTGLDNYMLENKAPFDEDTADCILKFLNRLQKPVCLVAHNGMNHDFRLLRHVYEKLNQTLPSTIYCVDSLPAFRKIDKLIESASSEIMDRRTQTNEASQKTNEQGNMSAKFQDDNPTSSQKPNATDDNSLTPSNQEVQPKVEKFKGGSPITEEKSHTYWQTINETTPTNKHESQSHAETHSLAVKKPKYNDRSIVKRQLQFDNRRSYELGKLYEYVFNTKCKSCHQAEADVKTLTKLILHYGKEFLKYAETNKQTFDKVPKLGAYDD